MELYEIDLHNHYEAVATLKIGATKDEISLFEQMLENTDFPEITGWDLTDDGFEIYYDESIIDPDIDDFMDNVNRFFDYIKEYNK